MYTRGSISFFFFLSLEKEIGRHKTLMGITKLKAEGGHNCKSCMLEWVRGQGSTSQDPDKHLGSSQ